MLQLLQEIKDTDNILLTTVYISSLYTVLNHEEAVKWALEKKANREKENI